MKSLAEIEKSLITTYGKSIFSRVTKAIKDYGLIRDGDRIAVCISGGKDSMLLAKCMQELKKHGKRNFELAFLVMDPGYNEENRAAVEANLAYLNIPATVFDSNIFDTVSKMDGSPCYVCARMRRGHLYAKAQELGCNKIALAHHFNDVIETILMGIFYNGRYQTMPPKLKSKNFNGMELIRPLYLVREQDIKSWKAHNGLTFIQCACRFTENCVISDDDPGASKRKEMKILIKNLKKTNPDIDVNIFNSAKNIYLDTVLGYIKGKEAYSFLDDYEWNEKK